MKQLMNTLYLTTPGTYVKREGESVEVHIDGKKKMEIPFIHLNGIVCFGNILISPGIISHFAKENRPIIWHDSIGRFIARLVGPTSGNVLLRKAQMEAWNDTRWKVKIAQSMVVGKIRNTREVILRGAREESRLEVKEKLRSVSRKLAHLIDRLAPDRAGSKLNMELLRGIEGLAAKEYFSVYGLLIRTDTNFFRFIKRTRRPPRDPVNTLLSFLYSLLLNECVSALEGIGLDPQFGYLHEIRPGRPSLALDIMEELRPMFADRLALTLINRKQITRKHFQERPGGSVLLTEKARKQVIIAYQERKQTERLHPVLEQQIPFGLIPHAQARLLARHLRGDIEQYIPYYFR